MAPKRESAMSRQFRYHLIFQEGLSPSTAETYVKQCRRAWRKAGDPGSAQSIAMYDATLTVKMRENFRAAWRHFSAFSSKFSKRYPLPPSRLAPLKPGELDMQRAKSMPPIVRRANSPLPYRPELEDPQARLVLAMPRPAPAPHPGPPARRRRNKAAGKAMKLAYVACHCGSAYWSDGGPSSACPLCGEG